MTELIDDEEPWIRPDARAVAKRCLVLLCVCAASSFEPGYFVDWLKRYALWDSVSPREAGWLTNSMTRSDRIQTSWQSECLAVMLWSIQALKDLPALDDQVDSEAIIAVVPEFGESPESFINGAALRPEAEIDKACEAMYQAHWEARDASIHGRKMPPGVDIGIVQERHRALNWLIGYDNLPWDKVTTDT